MAKSTPSLSVAIDTMVLIWGSSQSGEASLRQRARWLFESLEGSSCQIIVPSIVVSEYLCPIPKEQHSSVIAAISRRYTVVPFDVRCASLAAELFTSNKDAAKESGISRPVLKADSMIVASAKVYGAKILVSHDENCRAIASRLMNTQDLPDQPSDLFGYLPDS